MCTVAAATGRYFGGGMKIAPGAIVDDGEFDVVCLGDFHLHDFIFRGHRLYGGTHYSLKKVCHCRGKNVRIESGADVLLDVDGETPGRLPVEITVLPRSLRVLTGPHACVSGDVT
jgi:diacylglycerol kinase family enzyme